MNKSKINCYGYFEEFLTKDDVLQISFIRYFKVSSTMLLFIFHCDKALKNIKTQHLTLKSSFNGPKIMYSYKTYFSLITIKKSSISTY